jgi:hypothetical protein
MNEYNKNKARRRRMAVRGQRPQKGSPQAHDNVVVYNCDAMSSVIIHVTRLRRAYYEITLIRHSPAAGLLPMLSVKKMARRRRTAQILRLVDLTLLSFCDTMVVGNYLRDAPVASFIGELPPYSYLPVAGATNT